MGPGRKTAIAAGVAGGVIGAGAIAWLSLPGLIRDEATATIEARTGLQCTIASVHLGLDEVVLRGVELRDPAGSLEGRLAEVALDAGVIALARHGGDAVSAVVVRGGEIRVDASGQAFEALCTRVYGGGGPAVARGAEHAERSIEIEGLRGALRDGHGELAAATSIDLRLRAGLLSVVAHELRIAAGAPESARVDEIRVEGSVPDRRAARVDATGVLVEISDDEESEGALARARAIGRRMMGRAESTDVGGRTSTPLAFIGDDFAARIDQLSVRRRVDSGARDVLTGLHVEIDRASDDELTTQGSGSPDGGGRLAWNLRVAPLALRAEGSIELDDVAVAVVEPLLPSGLPLYRPEDARLGGELRIVGEGDALRATGRLVIRDLALASPRIAPQPIRGIALALDGEATFRPDQRRLEIARLRVQSGDAAHVNLRGAIEWADDHYLFDLEATLPATPCNDAIAAIPRDLLQELAALSLGGTIGGRIQARIDSRDLDASILTVRVADACRFEMVPPIADLGRFERPFTHRVEEPDGSIFQMETGPGTESWTAIESISPFMLQATLGHEDGGFFNHAGFSTFSIREALVRNLRAGRYVMGGSTITMQLVKNVFLRREKTLARKVQEVLLTWWIESAWPKERILELYLNVIEFGPGVYGIRNATHHYFGIEPEDLSPAQAAYLATILPNPSLYHSHWEAGALPATWVPRLTRFLRLLGERGRFDAIAVDEGASELESFRFHRAGDPPPPPRTFDGRTAALPLGTTGLIEHAWDEALDGEVVDPSEGGYE